MNYGLIKCAFGKHDYGRMLHDDMMNRWIKLCKRCGTITKVEAPKDLNGEPIDSHVWLKAENEKSKKELSDLIQEILDR